MSEIKPKDGEWWMCKLLDVDEEAVMYLSCGDFYQSKGDVHSIENRYLQANHSTAYHGTTRLMMCLRRHVTAPKSTITAIQSNTYMAI